MKILVTGATGLIGRALINRLILDGNLVTILTRNHINARKIFPSDVNIIRWNPYVHGLDCNLPNDIEAVVHLAGEPIPGLWHKGKIERIVESRVSVTRNLVSALNELDSPPRKILCASAVGFYGDRPNEILDEKSGSGEGFIPNLTREWEESLSGLVADDITPVVMRFGLVLSRYGGLLKRLLLPWKLGLGCKISNGLQWWPWVHIEDAVGMIIHHIQNNDLGNVVNCVAPGVVMQREFASQLAKTVKRPCLIRFPRWILRLLLGGMSWELLASRKVITNRGDYVFKFPSLNLALKDLISDFKGISKGGSHYETRMRIEAPVEKVFKFFSDPMNLERITPPWLKFQILTQSPLNLEVGTKIDYKLKLRCFPIRWQSEIIEWDPPRRFVDLQTRGPYRSWIHTHRFVAAGSGTIIIDIVDYKVLGGSLIDRLLVRRDLERIFSFRHTMIEALINDG